MTENQEIEKWESKAKNNHCFCVNIRDAVISLPTCFLALDEYR